MAMFGNPWWGARLLALIIVGVASHALAQSSIGQLSVPELEDALQVRGYPAAAALRGVYRVLMLTWSSNAHLCKS